MKWGILSGLFSSLLPAADLEAFAEECFSAKRRVEKLQGVVNPVVYLTSVEQTFLSASYSSKRKKGSPLLTLRNFECLLLRCRGKSEWNMEGVVSRDGPWQPTGSDFL